jgi:hypothetical protein
LRRFVGVSGAISPHRSETFWIRRAVGGTSDSKAAGHGSKRRLCLRASRLERAQNSSLSNAEESEAAARKYCEGFTAARQRLGVTEDNVASKSQKRAAKAPNFLYELGLISRIPREWET